MPPKKCLSRSPYHFSRFFLLSCSLGHLSDQFRARNGGFLEAEGRINNLKSRALLLSTTHMRYPLWRAKANAPHHREGDGRTAQSCSEQWHAQQHHRRGADWENWGSNLGHHKLRVPQLVKEKNLELHYFMLIEYLRLVSSK